MRAVGYDGCTRPRTVAYVQPTSEVGGSDIALYRMVTHLDPARYRPVVVLPREGPLLGKLQAAGVGVVILPMQQLRPIKRLSYQGRYLAWFWPTVVRLAALLRRERADLVHSNSLFGLYGPWAALLAGLPHVWHIREIPDVPRPVQRALAALALGLSARVVPMTNGVAQLFTTSGRLPARVVSIPDGIDLAAFHPGVSGGRIRSELGIEPHAPLVGFVARLDPWKGADVFVRAAAEVAAWRPDARFLVCAGDLPGYEAYAQGVKRLAGELGLDGRIHFTDWRYRLDDIPQVMAALDVFVHTSVRPEPFGLVLVEAMATARPVVAANAGGVPEVVQAGATGLLAEPGDWRGVAGAVGALLADPARARAMGEAGRRRAERLFEVRAYAARVQALYDEVLGVRAGVPA